MTSNRITKDSQNSGSLVSDNAQDADRTATKRICVLVLGTHRAGTSALTRVLSIAGARLPATLMGAAIGNDLGHWESNALVQLHDRVLDDLDSAWHDWRALELNRIPAKQRGDIKDEITGILQAEYAEAPLFVVKDPRICRFAPLFLEVLGSMSVVPRVILPMRNPLEVCESLERRDHMPRSEAALLWLRHVLDAEAATRAYPRAIVGYDQLLADWRVAFEALTAETGIDWPYGIKDITPQIDQFLSPAHRHHTRSTEQVILDPLLRDWIAETYEALLVLERNPGSDKALSDLDRIRAAFNQAAPILYRLREDVRTAWTAETRDLRAALSEAQEEREKLRTCLSERDDEVSALKASLSEAESKAEQLAASLAKKDAETDELRAALAEVRGERERLQASLTAHQEEAAGLKAGLAKAEERWRSLEKTYAQEKETLSREHQDQLIASRSETHQASAKLARSEERRWAYENSTSWRITKPLRSIGRFSRARKLRKLLDQLNIKREIAKNRSLVSRSGLFDEQQYRETNADLRKMDQIGLLNHFVEYGGKEGRSPSRFFDAAWYLRRYPDVAAAGINPIVHYLKFGKAEGRGRTPEEVSPDDSFKVTGNIPLGSALSIISTAPLPVPIMSEPVSIIVPVYNGKTHLNRLLSSLVLNTDSKHEIILIDDGSTEAEIHSLLERCVALNANVSVIRNRQNLGFVRTVNKAASCVDNHFVILNTDTVVPPNWLERLMAPILQDSTIASTTPFTNAATIFSYPKFPEDSPLIKGLSVNDIDRSFKRIQTPPDLSLDAPTGVGFCMGINRNVWNKLGGFDENAFGKGYGEENDWCQRAIAKGFKNILVPNLFVYHAHGGSFTPAETRALSKKNLSIINARWPEYGWMVGQFINSDKWHILREAASLHLCCANNPLLIIDHSLGGGANAYRVRLMQETLASGRPVILLTYDRRESCMKLQAEFGHAKALFSFSDISWFDNLAELLDEADIIYNNIVGWPDPLNVVNVLTGLAAREGIRLKILFHDYYAICPSFTLLSDRDVYCGVPQKIGECVRCLKKNNNAALDDADIVEWRQAWSSLLQQAHEIVFFSKSSRDIASRAWMLDPRKVSVRPHKPLSDFKPLNPPPQTNRLVVGVVGNLNLAKGAKIVSDFARELAVKDPKAEIVVLGNLDQNYRCEHSNLTIHGDFMHHELPDLMKLYGVNIGLVPSICPETFSYATSELIMMNLPIVCFDLGAQAERIRKFESGLVVLSDSVQDLSNAMIAFWNKQ